MTASPLPPDPYTALSLSKDATTDQIRSSYRKLVLKAHPDRFPQASPEDKQKKTDEFHRIQQAYELLTDDTRRQRYDERVKLAELKAELLKEKTASSRRPGRSAPGSGDYTHTRSFATPSYEVRPEAVRKERAPPKSSPMKPPPPPEEPSYPRYESSSKYDDYRSSPRTSKHEDPYKSSTRKAPSTGYDELRRGGSREERDGYEEKVAAKERQKQLKEREKQMLADKKKQRDKGRKQATETKQYFSSPRMNTYTETESSDEGYRQPVRSSRKKAEDAPHRSQREERPARRSRDIDEDHSDYTDDRSYKEHRRRENSRIEDAMQYIKLAVKSNPDPEEQPRTSGRPPPPAPPPPPTAPKEKTEASKRSSTTKKTATKASPPRESRRKERVIPDIVEPEPKTSRRPGLKTGDSAPPRVESEHRPPLKAATWQSQSRPTLERERDRDRERERHRDKEPPRASMRRTQTTPLQSMVDDTPTRSSYGSGASKLRRAETSREYDYESESDLETPIATGFGEESSNSKSTRFRYFEEPEEMQGHRIINIEPSKVDGRRSSRRDPSPRMRERTQSREVSPHDPRRPTMPTRSTGSYRVQRASTFADASPSPKTSPRPHIGIQRSASNHAGLFGEIMQERGDRPPILRSGSGVNTSYDLKDVRFSNPIDRSNIQFSERRRSPSERERDRGGRSSDTEPSRERRDSHMKDGFSGSRHGPSGLSRQATGTTAY